MSGVLVNLFCDPRLNRASSQTKARVGSKMSQCDESSSKDDIGLKKTHHSERTHTQQSIEGTNGGDTREWYLDDFLRFERFHIMSTNSMSSSDVPAGLDFRNSKPSVSRDNRGSESRHSKFALIILNQPIEMGIDMFLKIWREGILHSSENVNFSGTCDLRRWWSKPALQFQQ
jgi:hypothetical protein